MRIKETRPTSFRFAPIEYKAEIVHAEADDQCFDCVVSLVISGEGSDLAARVPFEMMICEDGLDVRCLPRPNRPVLEMEAGKQNYYPTDLAEIHRACRIVFGPNWESALARFVDDHLYSGEDRERPTVKTEPEWTQRAMHEAYLALLDRLAGDNLDGHSFLATDDIRPLRHLAAQIADAWGPVPADEEEAA